MYKGNGRTRSIYHGSVIALMFATAGLFIGAKPGSAQDWSLDSSISQRGTYNTNLQLTPTDKINAFGSLTIPKLTLERNSPTSTISLEGEFKFAEYFGHSELNSDAQIARLRSTKALSERSSIGLDGNFIRDTTLTSDDDITGRFLFRPIRFVLWDAAPSWTYALSPIDSIQWTASYQSKEYDARQKTDYQYYGTSLGYTRQLSELAQVTGSLSYFQFRPDTGTGTYTDIYGGLIGYKYQPTERFSVEGQVGLDYQNVHNPRQGVEDSQIGYRANFDLDYEINDTLTAKLLLSHDLEPSGDGLQVSRNRGVLVLAYSLNEKVQFSLLNIYADNDDFFSSNSDTRQDEGVSRYWAIGPNVTWNFLEDWALTASYQFRHKVAQGGDGSASDNAAFITLRYALPEQHWSGF